MDIIQSITIQSEKELIWKTWTEAERITKWFAPAAEIDSQVNGKFELYFNPANKDMMSTKGCTIMKFVPCELLAFQWKGPDPFAETMNTSEKLTIVEVTLESQSGGTRVTLIHTGWGDSNEWSQARDWHVQAWEQMLESLKSSIESGEGILCCE